MAGWFHGFKLQRVERKLKRAHHEQKLVRKEERELEEKRRSGTVAEDAYREERARLDARRQELRQEVSRLLQEEEALKRASGAIEA